MATLILGPYKAKPPSIPTTAAVAIVAAIRAGNLARAEAVLTAHGRQLPKYPAQLLGGYTKSIKKAVAANDAAVIAACVAEGWAVHP